MTAHSRRRKQIQLQNRKKKNERSAPQPDQAQPEADAAGTFHRIDRATLRSVTISEKGLGSIEVDEVVVTDKGVEIVGRYVGNHPEGIEDVAGFSIKGVSAEVDYSELDGDGILEALLGGD